MRFIDSRHSLFNAMNQGALVVTPNNRLSNQLLEDYAKQHAALTGVCDKPLCMPYAAFLRFCFKKVSDARGDITHPILLSASLERDLWRKILKEPCNDGLLDEIQEAWRRCLHWQIDTQHPAFLDTKQTRLFQHWCGLYQQQLQNIFAITLDQMADYLQPFQSVFPKNPVIWICFDDFSPAQRSLQKAIEHQYTYDLNHKSATAHQFIAKDNADERHHMLLWVKDKLKTSDGRIAVVVPELEQESKSLERFFQRHFEKHQFNISLGLPLQNYPLVAHALHWLTLSSDMLCNHDMRLLLYSPFLSGAQAEFQQRTDLMQQSDVLKEQTFALAAFVHAIKPKTPLLASLLENLIPYPEEATPKAWITHFKNRLMAIGFPGEHPLNSTSYQCLQRFMALMDELQSWFVIRPTMTKTEILNVLYQLAKSTIFQGQTATAPIQVLGLLEASGCCFENIWVTGMTDLCLPKKTRPSAFIPLTLQRSLHMPHAQAARELTLATQLLQRLRNGCHDIVFSHPKLTEDTPNLPSPLIQHLKECPRPMPSPRHEITKLVHYEEPYTLPLTQEEPIRGGTTLLSNQAKCPFRAFAAHRLHATPPPEVTEGPDAATRGQLVHHILEHLWRHFKTQAHLLALTPKQLDHHVHQAIVLALAPLIQQKSPAFPPLIQAIELNRLKRLINTCLTWEKQRTPFVIEALEQEYTLSLANLDFRVRLDRLDKLPDESTWVIDYKSRLPSHNPWYEERPEAPQLLLYALLDETINTLLFIELKQGRVAFSGLSEDPQPIPGVSALKKEERWTSTLQRFRKQLTELAKEFQAGHCPPTPQRKSTCLQCDFSLLCRTTP